MPIFEYRCEDCGHSFEAILFGEQKPECPKCHASRLETQISRFAVSTSASSSALPTMGCGQSNCCMNKDGGCSTN